MTKHKKLGCLFSIVVLLVLLCLPPLLLPRVAKQSLNRFVLPEYVTDPDIPLTGGSIQHMNWRGLQATGLTFGSKSETSVTLPEVNVIYSPRTLLKKRIESVEGRIHVGPSPDIDAGFRVEAIRLAPKQLEATVSVDCPRFQVQDVTIGPLALYQQILGTDTALDFTLPIQNGLMNAHIEMAADWKSNLLWSCRAELPLSSADGGPLRPGALVHAVKDLEVLGSLQLEAAGGPEEPVATVDAAIQSLSAPEQSLTLHNLTTRCALQLAGELRSLPAQQLTVESISIGELELKNLRLQYQFEPRSVFYIEDLELDLCDGQVSLHNVRIRPNMSDIAVRLQCDRLSMEQVLTACGVNSFAGDGELNGRLPIRWDDGMITIDRGFLFTTPGRSGTFSIGNTEAIAGILPAGAAGQVGLVSAALEAFRYDWITMTLNSEGEDLNVTVEMSGTPVNVLPYAYDTRSETYVKIELKKPGQGIRQTMQFQLNLSVPLNRLLCYASGINRQWNLFNAK